MKKSTTIFDFFKRKASSDLEANNSSATLHCNILNTIFLCIFPY